MILCWLSLRNFKRFQVLTVWTAVSVSFFFPFGWKIMISQFQILATGTSMVTWGDLKNLGWFPPQVLCLGITWSRLVSAVSPHTNHLKNKSSRTGQTKKETLVLPNPEKLHTRRKIWISWLLNSHQQSGPHQLIACWAGPQIQAQIQLQGCRNPCLHKVRIRRSVDPPVPQGAAPRCRTGSCYQSSWNCWDNHRNGSPWYLAVGFREIRQSCWERGVRDTPNGKRKTTWICWDGHVYISTAFLHIHTVKRVRISLSICKKRI